MSISSTKNNEKENIKISSPIIINNGDSSSFSTEKLQRTTSDRNKKMVKKLKIQSDIYPLGFKSIICLATSILADPGK